MELKETVEMMCSSDYQERFKAEYYQLKIRYDKLCEMCQKWDEGKLAFTPACSRGTYNYQLEAMYQYLQVLENRAYVEGIDLEQKVYDIEWFKKEFTLIDDLTSALKDLIFNPSQLIKGFEYGRYDKGVASFFFIINEHIELSIVFDTNFEKRKKDSTEHHIYINLKHAEEYLQCRHDYCNSLYIELDDGVENGVNFLNMIIDNLKTDIEMYQQVLKKLEPIKEKYKFDVVK